MANDFDEKLAVGGDFFIRENRGSRGYNSESVYVDNSDDVTGIGVEALLPAGYPLDVNRKPMRHVGGSAVYLLLEPLKIAASTISIHPVAVATTGESGGVISTRDIPLGYSAAADGSKLAFTGSLLATIRGMGFVDRATPLQVQGPQVK